MGKNLTFKKDGVTLDVITRAENVKYNDTNVKEEINKINRKIETISTSGDGEIIIDNSEHNNLKINSEEGAHGLRYFDEKFSVKEDDEWIDVVVSNSNSITDIKLPPTKFIEIISRTIGSDEVTIKWDDADDQVLNGAIIAKWEGTKLIKKLDSPPMNEFDGEILIDNKERNKYKINGYIDRNVELGKVYYYALFPYSTDGTYNYDISNVRKFYKTEEDVPNSTTDIVLIPIKNAVKLKWTDGESSSTALWSGTRVIRKVGSPPTTEIDGILILDNTTRDRYKTTYFIDDTATQNVDYYYGFFPYSTNGHYNMGTENIKRTKPITGKIYTLSIDMNNSSPSDACSYLDDALGMRAGEDWDSIDIFNPKICTFKNGKVNYYLNPNNYAERLDDDSSSGNLNGIDGDIMAEIPFIAIKFSNPNDTTLKISITGDRQVVYSDLGFDYSAFIDKDGNIANKIYHGVYQGYIDSGIVYSKSGVVPQKYKIQDIINSCKAKGEFYSLFSGDINFLLYCLYTIRFKTRSVFDNLVSDSNTFVGETGTGNNDGLWHKGDVGKIAGIEWGSINCNLWLAGIRYEHSFSSWSSSHGESEQKTIGIIEKSNPIDEARNIKTTGNMYFYSTNSKNSINNTGNLHGYLAKAKAYLDGCIFPFPKQSGGSSSTYFVAYTNFTPSGTDSTASHKKDMYINFKQAPYKSFLNFYAQHENQRNTTSEFGTYLTYVKGESEE